LNIEKSEKIVTLIFMLGVWILVLVNFCPIISLIHTHWDPEKNEYNFIITMATKHILKAIKLGVSLKNYGQK
jgi:F0F1-type ATP synthase membrane subunit a